MKNWQKPRSSPGWFFSTIKEMHGIPRTDDDRTSSKPAIQTNFLPPREAGAACFADHGSRLGLWLCASWIQSPSRKCEPPGGRLHVSGRRWSFGPLHFPQRRSSSVCTRSLSVSDSQSVGPWKSFRRSHRASNSRSVDQFVGYTRSLAVDSDPFCSLSRPDSLAPTRVQTTADFFKRKGNPAPGEKIRRSKSETCQKKNPAQKFSFPKTPDQTAPCVLFKNQKTPDKIIREDQSRHQAGDPADGCGSSGSAVLRAGPSTGGEISPRRPGAGGIRRGGSVNSTPAESGTFSHPPRWARRTPLPLLPLHRFTARSGRRGPLSGLPYLSSQKLLGCNRFLSGAAYPSLRIKERVEVILHD